MKIHHVTDNSGAIHLVRAHTIAGARKFVAAKLGQNMTAKVPTQDELVAALQSGVTIEDATAPAGSGTPDETQEQAP